MRPKLKELADSAGMKLSNRSSYNDYFWNGKDLALFFQLENYSSDYNSMKLSLPQPHNDLTLAHEIAHYIVAAPEEREFPEYGCDIGFVSNAEGPSGFQENVLTKREQLFREVCADILGCDICMKIGIKVKNEWLPFVKYKNTEVHKVCIKAQIWLNERGFLNVI